MKQRTSSSVFWLRWVARASTRIGWYLILLLVGFVGAPAVLAATCPSGSNAVGTTESGTICQVMFNTSGTWTPPSGVTSVDVFLVGGGGGGGGSTYSSGSVPEVYTGGNGGGGGKVTERTRVAVTPGTAVSVTVGAGGTAGSNVIGSATRGTNGGNGTSSVFGTITAAGGGGGEAGSDSGTITYGGSSGLDLNSTVTNRTGGASFNHINDASTKYTFGGGGAGAGGNGKSAGSDAKGDGGAGVAPSTGLFVGYNSAPFRFAGGGGGTNGYFGFTSGSATDGGERDGKNGWPYTGGGGGGGRAWADEAVAGAGGSGIVIVRFVPPQVPTVTLVTPSSGPLAGGTSLTITGTALTGATAITVGGTACTSFSVTNATTATCTTPAGTAGSASVEVTTPGGTSAVNTLYTYLAGAVAAAQSTVTASAASVVADGTTTATITVTLKDANGNLVPGKTVELEQGTGSSTITPETGNSDAAGVVTFSVKSTTAETVTYTATGDGVVIAQTAQVAFTPLAAAGACGTAADTVNNAAAPTEGLCATGSMASAVSPFEGGYSWSCRGEPSGAIALCTAWTLAAPPFSPTGTTFEQVDNPPVCNVERVALIPAPTGGPTEGGDWEMPYGVLDFELVGCSADSVRVRMTFPEALSSGVAWKYGPKDVVNRPNDYEWYPLPGAISGNAILLTLTDNQLGDGDPAIRAISDPAGPAFLPGGGPGVPVWRIGGTVTGLAQGTTVVLRNNGGDDLPVTANGPFTFATAVIGGAAYQVTGATQPAGQSCSVTNGSGIATADVQNVGISCQVPTPIPTLSEWAMGLLMVLLLALGMRNRGRLA